MFEGLKRGVGEFLGTLNGTMPSEQRDYGSVQEPFQEAQGNLGEKPVVRLVNDITRSSEPFIETPYGHWTVTPCMQSMLERYPDARLPAEETRELFKNAPHERLKELGIDESRLRSYAFSALRTVEENLLNSGPVSPEEKAALVQEAAAEWLQMAMHNFSQALPWNNMASLEETKRIFPDVSVEQLEEMGMSMDNLRRIVFWSRKNAEYQHNHGTALARDPVEELTVRFSRNNFRHSVEYKRNRPIDLQDETL